MTTMVAGCTGFLLLAVHISLRVNGQNPPVTAPALRNQTTLPDTTRATSAVSVMMNTGVNSSMATFPDATTSNVINRVTNFPAVTAAATNTVRLTATATTTRPVSATATRPISATTTTKRPVSATADISNPKAAGVSLQSRSSTVLILLVGSLLHGCC
ncbi:hypothetical protein DPEC_G00314370 [Dallia pectoralis]|uniref:Uncharacterized protein n=1 Tax=Dallia pectoralis TaxID=75939 RepID=A0ACC2FCD1_DALPE|nr:hypothetical protein DPEC_G00314370 [Dallia pectoralis]